jgi:hypothetical protein
MGASYHLTPTGGLAAGGTGPVLDLRGTCAPYRISASGGFTGSAVVQHNPHGDVWFDLQPVASGQEYTVADPLRKVRLSGAHTGTPAVVSITDNP